MKKQYTSAFKAQLVLELLKENKSLAQLAAEHKVHPNQLRQWRDQAVKELPTLFERKAQTADLVAAHERQSQELFAEIGRLTTSVAWLKKNLASTLPRGERVGLVERGDAALPLVVQAELLSLSRASLYYRAAPPSVQEVALKQRIDELSTRHPFYGSRRIAACLQREGLIVNPLAPCSVTCVRWGLRASVRDQTSRDAISYTRRTPICCGVSRWRSPIRSGGWK